jgi:hypothetical protein
MDKNNQNNQLSDVWDLSEQNTPPPIPFNSEPVFYYSREKHRAHGARALRDFNKPAQNSRFGFFRPLVAHPVQRRLFSSILFMAALIALISVVTKQTSTIKLGRNTITATARRDNGSTYITFTKTFKNVNGVYTGAVDVAAGIVARPQATTRKSLLPQNEQRVDADHPIIADRIYFTLEPQEIYELTLPYEASDLLIFMQTETERTTFRVKPK